MKNPTPLAHRIRAKQFQYDKRWNEAYSEAERAIALDPNDPQGYRAMSDLLVNLGRTAEGLEFIKKAIRLDPQSDYFDALGWAQFHLERYDEAAANFLRFSKLYPEDQWNHLWLAAAYGHLGREQDAISAFATFNELNVKHDPILWKDLPWTLARLSNWTIKDEAGLERLRAGLRVAGVPEGETGRLVDLKFTDLVTVLAGTFDVEGAIEIDAAEAKTLHDHGIAFFDSRGKGHYGRGHIPGATNLYFHQVRESLADLVEQNAEVVFYCGDPKCHLAANSSAQALILGYTRVYYFAGGFSAWEVAGYPVEGS